MFIRLLLLLLILPSSANANIGIPVVAFGLPFLLANLIFVVLIEAYVQKRSYAKLGNMKIVKHVFIANLITTLIGYPLVATFTAMTALFGLNLGWVLPFEHVEEMNFYTGTAMLLTLIPCYFLSVWIEGLWLKRKLSKVITWKNMFTVHFASYLFLIAQAYIQLPFRLLDYATYTYEPGYIMIINIIELFIGKH